MSSFYSTPGPSFNPPLTQFANFKAGLRHATVRQVLKAVHVETHFEIDGREVEYIVLLANVYDVEHKSGKLVYGLDDGTGRIRASCWVTDDAYAEREVAEYQQEQFVYARVIGKISEYRGIYSVQLEKINRVVKSYEEIWHHLLSSMVETQMCELGPPSRAAVQAASDAAKINYPPPEPIATKPWRDEVPRMTDVNTSDPPSSPPPPRTPSPSIYHTPKSTPATEPRKRRVSTPMTPSSTTVSRPNTAPQRRTYRIGTFSSPGETSSFVTLQPPQRHPAPPSPSPVRLKSLVGRSAASTAIVNRLQASPEFVPPTSSPSFRSANLGLRRNSEGTRITSPTRVFSPEVLPERRSARTISRDPYSHLSSLQREIILTIQNVTLTSGETEEGVAIDILARAIARGHPDISIPELSEAFDILLEKEYICNTIDEDHFACKM